MGSKLTEPMDRLRKQRSKWRKQVNAAETNWTDCADEDRAEMKAELTAHLAQLAVDIQAGTADDFTKADLRQRIMQLRQRLDRAAIASRQNYGINPAQLPEVERA